MAIDSTDDKSMAMASLEDDGHAEKPLAAASLGDPDYEIDPTAPAFIQDAVAEIKAKPTPAFNVADLISDHEYQYKGEGFAEKLPTGMIPFDVALGGGVPLGGAIIEIWGEESHGKTTLTYRICKRVTDVGGYVSWFDNETSYDEGWAQANGLNTDMVIPYRPPYMEKGIEIILGDIKKYKERFLPWLAHSGRGSWSPTKQQAEAAGTGVRDIEGVKAHMKEVAPPHILVWDTLANCPLKTVVEGAEFGGGMALRARLIKSFISRFQVEVEGCSKVSIILINQVIDNIGDQWNPMTTPGGRGLRHGKHLSIFVKKAGRGEKDEQQVQATDYIMLSLTKNKVTPVVASFPVIFSKSKGFIGATALLEYLMLIKWFKQSGSWHKFQYRVVDKETGEVTHDEEISLQRGTFYKLIESRPELLTYLTEQVRDIFIEKFPFNATLVEMDIKKIVDSCRFEESAMPDEDEVEAKVSI